MDDAQRPNYHAGYTVQLWYREFRSCGASMNPEASTHNRPRPVYRIRDRIISLRHGQPWPASAAGQSPQADLGPSVSAWYYTFALLA